jgi:capsular exopolysaccharide synthesis family protein
MALEEFQKVESQLAIERTRYEETHPTIDALKHKRASLESLLKERLKQVFGGQKQDLDGNLQIGQLKQQLTEDIVQSEAKRLATARQVSTLSNVLANYKRRASNLPRLEQRQRQLELELEAAQSTYKTLLTRLEEIRVEENRSVGNVRIVDEAQVSEESVEPDKVKNLALGNVLGILLAIGIALVLETLDTSIKTIKEAREVFGYTLLGMIPVFGKSEKPTPQDGNSEQSATKIVVRDTPRSPISEAYRMLQANLKFIDSDKELKAIVVTSSVPQEGKSTVSANLAIVMAQSGHRVLLVDADMRSPMQHRIWELVNEAGLSNVIVGHAELKTAIKEVMDNLHVLSAGVIPPNPMALLDSQRMALLIENFSDSYDFAIIDTPSLKVAADALILGKMADGVLLVVRPGVVDSANAASAKQFLEQSGQNVLGQVVNGVTFENEPYNYYAKESYAEEDSTTRETVTSETRTN